MTDVFSPEKRSVVMASIRGQNTKPEIRVRSILHRLGFRFRLHRSDLPGTPDIVLSRYKAVIMVHGCFWHQHKGCAEGRLPRSRLDFWEPKLRKNVERDARNVHDLHELGWRAMIVWECELKDESQLQMRLVHELKHG